jgi:SAM-dependent methyltransferase
MEQGADAVDRYGTYEKAGWEQKAEPYYVSCRPITDRLIDPLLDAAHVSAGMRVLDIGTGPGDVAAESAERGAEVVGLDFAEAMVTLASRTHPGLTFVVGDAQNPPFADRSFDAIVGNFTFHHLSDQRRALASWRRLLRPGGWLALTAWDVPAANRLMGLFVDAVAAAEAVPPPEVPVGPPMTMTDDSYHEALRLAGFNPTLVGTVRFTLQLATTDALWNRMLASSLRTAALVAEQPPDLRERIRAAFDRLAESYMTPVGLAVPVSVKLISGSMPSTVRAAMTGTGSSRAAGPNDMTRASPD